MDVLLTSADNGTTLSLRPGDSGELRLPETPTTGYRWSLDPPPPILALSEGDPGQNDGHRNPLAQTLARMGRGSLRDRALPGDLGHQPLNSQTLPRGPRSTAPA